jgi:hypothetical protein
MAVLDAMRTAQLKPSVKQGFADDVAEGEAAVALAAAAEAAATSRTTGARTDRGRDDSAAAAAAAAMAGGEATAAPPPCWTPLHGTSVYRHCPGDERRWIDDARDGAAAAEDDEDRTKWLVTEYNSHGYIEHSVDEHSRTAHLRAAKRGGGGEAFAPGFGRWLNANPLAIEEEAPMQVTASLPCPSPCGNGGWCNRQVGKCHCPTGWGGVDCAARDSWPCNLPKDGAEKYNLVGLHK